MARVPSEGSRRGDCKSNCRTVPGGVPHGDWVESLEHLLRRQHLEVLQMFHHQQVQSHRMSENEDKEDENAVDHLVDLTDQYCHQTSLPSMLSVPASVPLGPVRSFRASQVEKMEHARSVQPDPVDGKHIPFFRSEQTRLRSFINAPWYECFCSLLIVSNAIFFGIEAHVLMVTDDNGETAHAFAVATHTFTTIFVVELLLRALADHRAFLCSPQWLWNLLDLVLVTASLCDAAASIWLDGNSSANFSYLRLIRLARTVRVFRFVRVLKAFTSLRILVNSVLGTMKSLTWTMLLLGSILYLFGLLFTQATAKHIRQKEGSWGELEEHLLEYFGSVGKSMYTLFKVITNGLSWGELAHFLGSIHPVWEGVFLVYVIFTEIAVLNVVTGVFCQSAIEGAQQDKDTIVQAQLTMTEKYRDQLIRLFRQIDDQHTGVVTLPMFEACLEDDQMKAYFDGLDITTDDAWNLFKLLDTNESHAIDLDEFVRGCLRLQGTARSVDTHMLLYESRWTMSRIHEVLNSLRAIRTSTIHSPCMSDCVGHHPELSPSLVLRSERRRSFSSVAAKQERLVCEL